MLKYGQNGGQNGQNGVEMCTGYTMAVTKENLGHYYFRIAGLLRGQNQLVYEVTAPALLKYGQKCTLPMCDFEKSSVLHIFAHKKYVVSDHWQMHNRALKLVF